MAKNLVLIRNGRIFWYSSAIFLGSVPVWISITVSLWRFIQVLVLILHSVLVSVSVFRYRLNTKFYYCQQYTYTQVNLKSCCVVPEELSNFAKSNKLTLLTHSDPGELLPGDCLRNMLYPKLAREAGHYAAHWVARYDAI